MIKGIVSRVACSFFTSLLISILKSHAAVFLLLLLLFFDAPASGSSISSIF